MKKRVLTAILGIVMAGMLAACGKEAETEQPVETETVKPLEGVQQTEAPEIEEAPESSEEIPVISEDRQESPEEDETVMVFEEKEGLPLYKSAASGTIEEAITLYFWKEYNFDTVSEEDAVNIPAYVIFKTSNDADGITRVYGIFSVYEYKLEDKNLSCISGVSYPGVFYLRPNENGYDAEGFLMAEEGEGYTESIDTICAGDEELKELFLDTDGINIETLKARRNFIKLYAVMNNLEIESFRDEGADPVMINEELLQDTEEDTQTAD